MATTLVKKYIYNVYNPMTGLILGTLANVKSEFSYSQNINSGGSELSIVLSSSFDDVGAVQSDDFWVDESGNRIVDEAGNRLVWSKRFDFNSIPIDLGNRIKVYASYDGQPSGVQVFDGFISKWGANYSDNTITLTVLSWGAQLDNYLINTDPSSQTISQTVADKEYTPGSFNKAGGATPIAQSFNLASATTVGSITVYVRSSSGTFVGNPKSGETITPLVIIPWELYSGTPSSPGSLIDSGQVDFAGTNISVRQITLQFTEALSLSGDYFLALYNGHAGSWYYASPVFQATATNPYAGGKVWTGLQGSGGSVTWTAVNNDDLAFTVQTSTGGTQLIFTNNDPSGILERILDQLASQGGLVRYSDASIDSTGIFASYSYKLQTMLEGIQRILALAPGGWYWYLDVATNFIHFHNTANSVEHRFILGNHITELNLEYSLEQIVNTVHFSGGPTAGVNLYVSQKDAKSAQQYGQWLERVSDNRVTDATTANILAAGTIGASSQPAFNTTVQIHASTYDIESIAIGDTVGFRGFNNLIDTLQFQVSSKQVMPDMVTLTLGTLPSRVTGALEAVNRRLDLLETIDNPTTPS